MMFLSDIDVGSINTEFTPFSFSYAFDLFKLTDSIKKVGLINPPILRMQKSEFIIVVGYKRVLALKRLGWEKTKGFILPEDESPLECLLMNFYENLSVRKLNEIEKAIFLSKLSNYIKPEEIIEKYLPLLDLPKRRSTYEMYIWMESLSEKAKRLIAFEDISIKAIRLMYEREIPLEEINIYIDLMGRLRFSFNEQIQFIEYTNDICKKENIGLKELLKRKEIREIVKDSSLGRKDKVKRLLEELKKINFPNLYIAEEKFRKMVESCNLPDGVEIRAPFHFESGYRMEISFKDGKELIEKLRKLAENKELEKIKDPWKEK